MYSQFDDSFEDPQYIFWLKKNKKINKLNKSENATPVLFAIYIQNYANQECNGKCILMFKYCVMHNSKSFQVVNFNGNLTQFRPSEI